jgi:hypothetical protein
MTNNITAHLRWDEMSQEQRIMHTAIGALLHEIGSVFQNAARRYRAIAKDPLSGTNVEKLIEGLTKKKKPKPPDSDDQTKAGSDASPGPSD